MENRYFTFLVRLQNFEKRLLDSSYLPARLSLRQSIRMKQLDFHWTDCDRNWYMSIFRKSVDKNQVSLKYGKNNGYFI